MIERIVNNEKRLDDVLKCIKDLEEALNNFNKNRRNIDLLNRYYGSKGWFKDKENYENNTISDVKAGVLAEDTIWNMNEDISDIILMMRDIVKNYDK